MTQDLAVAPSPTADGLPVERAARLLAFEQIIDRGLLALYHIYAEQLYLEAGDASFDAYVARRWGWKARYARELRNTVLPAFGAILAHVHELPEGVDAPEESPLVQHSTNGTGVPLPAYTTQLRGTSGLEPAQVVEAWTTAVAAAGGEQPTEPQMKAAVEAQRSDTQADRDRRFVERYAGQYPYILEAVDGDTMRLADAALLVDTLNGIQARPRIVAVKAQLTDLTLIREINRICPSDTFDEIEASGVLELPNGYVPLANATAVHLRTMLDARRKMHQTLAREANHDIEVFKADVVEIGTETEMWAGSQTEVVFVTMIMPKAVANKLTTENRYSFTVEVPKKKEVR